MKNLNLPIILNGVIAAALSFFCFTVICTLLPVGPAPRIIFSLVLTAGFTVGFVLIQKDALINKRARLERDGALNRGEYFLHTCPYDVAEEIFLAYFSNMGIRANARGQYMSIGDKYALCLLLFPDEGTQNDVKRAFFDNPFPHLKLGIVSKDFSEGASDLSEALGVELIKTEAIVPRLLEKNLIPLKAPPKKNFPLNIKKLFTKKSGKKFVAYGITLFIFSTFAFYPTYYVISGTVFIVYGLIALLFSKKSQQIKKPVAFFEVFDGK